VEETGLLVRRKNRRNKLSETRREKQNDRTARSSYVPYIWTFAGLAIVLLLGITIRPKNNDVPEEIQGVWRTNDPAHADRFFEISLVSVSFGTGNGTVSTGFIQKIETAPQASGTLYTITYKDEEGEQQVVLSYEPRSGTLRFKNQDKAVWKKVQES
jgi:hypothetical protein